MLRKMMPLSKISVDNFHFRTLKISTKEDKLIDISSYEDIRLSHRLSFMLANICGENSCKTRKRMTLPTFSSARAFPCVGYKIFHSAEAA
jgi:hypothetical protein